MKSVVSLTVLVAAAGMLTVWTARAAEGKPEVKKEEAKEVTVTGEVLDLGCFIDHGAKGEKHADCAKKCIASGLPVGLQDKDGKVFLLIGDHKPMNAELAEHAAKTITVKGKLVQREGLSMIENAVIQ